MKIMTTLNIHPEIKQKLLALEVNPHKKQTNKMKFLIFSEFAWFTLLCCACVTCVCVCLSHCLIFLVYIRGKCHRYTWILQSIRNRLTSQCMPGLHCYVMPVLLVCVFAYLIASSFLSTYEVSVKESIFELLVGIPTMWFPNGSDTNRAVQLQKQARSLKFRI